MTGKHLVWRYGVIPEGAGSVNLVFMLSIFLLGVVRLLLSASR
jgi:hypothetical protein